MVCKVSPLQGKPAKLLSAGKFRLATKNHQFKVGTAPGRFSEPRFEIKATVLATTSLATLTPLIPKASTRSPQFGWSKQVTSSGNHQAFFISSSHDDHHHHHHHHHRQKSKQNATQRENRWPQILVAPSRPRPPKFEAWAIIKQPRPAINRQ